MSKIALITGATAGIGEATAVEFAKLSYKLILTGRREERLANLAAQLNAEYDIEIRTLTFDIRCKDEVEHAIAELDDDWKKVDILINNAGLALGLSTIDKGNLDDWNQMIDTNVKGLLYITKQIAPQMIERQTGHIVNISSIAGKEVYPNGNVYCATKHAVEALTKGMRIDFLPHGIKVSSVAPGMVNTEFSTVRFHGNKPKADAVYQGFSPLTAQDIAQTITYIVTRPKHVNINDVLIMPTAQASATHTLKT